MKKLFFASIVMLATLTACNNAETSTAPEEQQNQTFSGTMSARYGDEKEDASQAEIIVQKDMEAGGGTDNVRILCHTPYGSTRGNACVKVNNHLFNVTWYIDPYQTDPDVGGPWQQWTSNLVSSCNCR